MRVATFVNGTFTISALPEDPMFQVATDSANGPVLSEVDRLFATLDGASIPGESGEWHSRVQGIHADGPYIWLQLQRDEDDTQSAVLRLPRAISLDALLDALMAVLPSIHFGDDAPQIVKVPQFG
jgi:hypothetical protein